MICTHRSQRISKEVLCLLSINIEWQFRTYLIQYHDWLYHKSISLCTHINSSGIVSSFTALHLLLIIANELIKIMWNANYICITKDFTTHRNFWATAYLMRFGNASCTWQLISMPCSPRLSVYMFISWTKLILTNNEKFYN